MYFFVFLPYRSISGIYYVPQELLTCMYFLYFSYSAAHTAPPRIYSMSFSLHNEHIHELIVLIVCSMFVSFLNSLRCILCSEYIFEDIFLVSFGRLAFQRLRFDTYLLTYY